MMNKNKAAALHRSELHNAVIAKDLARVRSLLESGADPSARDGSGWTPLHFSAQDYSLEIAELLLDFGANIDAQNSQGQSPLYTAVFNSRGRGDLIKLLRKRGANPEQRNLYGKTPIGLAKAIANYDLVAFFSDAGADMKK